MRTSQNGGLLQQNERRNNGHVLRRLYLVARSVVCVHPFFFVLWLRIFLLQTSVCNDSYQEGQYDSPQLSHDNLCTGHKGLNVGVVQEHLLQEVNRERKDPVKEAAAARERYLKVSIFSPVSNIMVRDCCRSACLCGGIPIHHEVAIWLLSSSYSYWLFVQPTC